MAKADLTAARLREAFHYDVDTGLFYRRGGSPSPLGSVGRYGYISVSIDGHVWLAHRLAWFYVYGTLPEGQLDHINRVRSDNRIANLRPATNKLNMENRKVQSNNKSGCPGVHFSNHSQKWRARIKHHGVFVELGMHKDFESAKAAYLEARSRLFTFAPDLA